MIKALTPSQLKRINAKIRKDLNIILKELKK